MNGANDLIPVNAGMPRLALCLKSGRRTGMPVRAFRCPETRSSAAAVLQPCRNQALECRVEALTRDFLPLTLRGAACVDTRRPRREHATMLGRKKEPRAGTALSASLLSAAEG